MRTFLEQIHKSAVYGHNAPLLPRRQRAIRPVCLKNTAREKTGPGSSPDPALCWFDSLVLSGVLLCVKQVEFRVEVVDAQVAPERRGFVVEVSRQLEGFGGFFRSGESDEGDLRRQNGKIRLVQLAEIPQDLLRSWQ